MEQMGLGEGRGAGSLPLGKQLSFQVSLGNSWGALRILQQRFFPP